MTFLARLRRDPMSVGVIGAGVTALLIAAPQLSQYVEYLIACSIPKKSDRALKVDVAAVAWPR